MMFTGSHQPPLHTNSSPYAPVVETELRHTIRRLSRHPAVRERTRFRHIQIILSMKFKATREKTGPAFQIVFYSGCNECGGGKGPETTFA